MQRNTAIEEQDYQISTDADLLDIDMIHAFLCNDSYWAKGIPREKVERYIRHSLNFGIYCDGKQVGYARVISDFTTIAYLGDVFVVPAYRGKSLSKKLIGAIMKHPDLQGLRRWILLTSDAHGLYRSFGWRPIAGTERWMEKI